MVNFVCFKVKVKKKKCSGPTLASSGTMMVPVSVRVVSRRITSNDLSNTTIDCVDTASGDPSGTM